MPKFSSKRRVQHSAAQMFDLVADVERYPEFVPLCRSLKIRQRTPKPDGTEIVICEMTVSFKLVREAALALNDKGFDVEIIERHHRFKADSPSGTALHFVRVIQEAMGDMPLRHGRDFWRKSLRDGISKPVRA